MGCLGFTLLILYYILSSGTILTSTNLYLISLLLSVTHIVGIFSFKTRFLYPLVVIYGIVFIITTPYFSPIDEGAHYDYIRHIMDYRKLPTLYDMINTDALARVAGNAIPTEK